jgi:hypothetical protein
LLSASNFVGVYENEVYGNVTITNVGDAITLSFEHHKNLSAKLEYMGSNHFLCTYNNSLFGIKVFPFVIKDNEVKSFTLSVADFLEYTTYEFIKKK